MEERLRNPPGEYLMPGGFLTTHTLGQRTMIRNDNMVHYLAILILSFSLYVYFYNKKDLLWKRNKKPPWPGRPIQNSRLLEVCVTFWVRLISL